MTVRTHADCQAAFNAGADLEAATYYLIGKITLADNTKISGRGRGATFLKLSNGANPGNESIIQHSGTGPLPACGYYNENVTLSGFTVDGNRSNNTGIQDGILGSGIKNFTAYDIETMECTETGFVLSSTFSDDNSYRTPNMAWGIYSHDNTEDGIQMAVGILSKSFAYLNGCGFRVVSAYADPLRQPYAQLSDVNAYSNGVAYLFESQGGAARLPVTLTNGVANRNSQGLVSYLEGTSIVGGSFTYNTIQGITLLGDHQSLVGATISRNGSGVIVWGDRSNLIITGNHIITNDGYGMTEYGVNGYGHGNIISGNNLTENILGAFLPVMKTRMYSISNNVEQ